ncbi:uncharacterized protein L3040_003578 [Drepanopeziza brunnea f. sp. 'multigermtubi']|uniref:Uncharacterized protein n=1 Tax=Marssonina brunnea f. sp. multigermtubi (strain MB_m1) TaxID=1072389 RepID=K1WXB8_MARBU|nr:uncharacterized protein MBM_04065 [Drepanopeziza brunnea f. sp. 'multigermtubi' MB_m1]EKD17696.1 hypothetical protein MBM_04065 [Drepanopeziza brunnea f. sp. 'multigermtubi' MB_m1]KAJ5046333.1 hypothetical protein L3040_003578 [Drepanopeziza brunnea f. sp. 'multigermtubi']
MADLPPLPPLPSPRPLAGPRRPLTTWARKYGLFSPTSHKSGYTPTEYKFPTLGAVFPDSSDRYEQYQRKNLNGFTTRELGQLDCLPTRELIPGNLPKYILPMLARQNWETNPVQPDFPRSDLYALEDGRGMWSAHNDVVWPILEPILVLASKILGSAHLLPWFDAVLRAERKPVPSSRLKPEDQGRTDLRYIEPRTVSEFNPQMASTADRDMAFGVMQNRYQYTFGFMRHDEDPMDPGEDPPGKTLAYTGTNSEYMRYDPTPNKLPRLFTWLSLHEFELLLRDDLNSAERMSIEWSIANTISHEVMHAVDFLFTHLQGDYETPEVYFDQEPLSELGFSFEKAVNLGSTMAMISVDDTQIMPLGWFFSRCWPTAPDVAMADAGAVELINPGVQLFDEFFPIPISFYQDVQQEEFWSVGVQKFGHGLLHYRTRKEGSRVLYTIDPKTGKLKVGHAIRFSAFDQTFMEATNRFISKVEMLTTALSLTPEDREAMRFGRALLFSSQAEQMFWDNTTSQQALVKTAMDVMASAASAPPTDETRRMIFNGLLQCMLDAISTHQVQIASILSLESVNNTRYPDRRTALKSWNRGTRVFIRNLKRADATNAINAEKALLDLELCHMVLYDPADPSMQASEEFFESQSLTLARICLGEGDYSQCRDLCNGVLGLPWCTVFGRCGAEAILFALDRDLFEGWDERKASFAKMVQRMAYCEAGAPATWKSHWATLKSELVDPASQIPRPPDPNAPQPVVVDIPSVPSGRKGTEGSA